MSLRPAAALACVCLLSFACLRSESSTLADRSEPGLDGGAPLDPESERLLAEVTALSKDAEAYAHAVDERLWAHWTTGAPLDLSTLSARRDALVAPARLATLARALERHVGAPVAVLHVHHFLRAESIQRQLAAENDAVATLEGRLAFSFEGKEVRWVELNRLLAAEKSALKRKALWTASLTAAAQLDEALAARDARFAKLVAPQTPLSFFSEQRAVDPEAMRRIAEGVLLLTEDAWRLTLERLNAADTKLPVAQLTRADLPRLIRVPADADLPFDKRAQAQQAVATLGSLGLYGVRGLTLDLADTTKKHPLPLTVTPGGPDDVRVSVRPLGGLRDQQLLLSELGVALTLRYARTQRFETDRLGDPALAQASGALFAALLLEPGWLEALGLSEPARKLVVETATVQRLFQVRRAAAAWLVRLDCVEPNDAQARTRAAAIFNRALGVIHTEADMVRMRIDTDDGLRSATLLRAILLGEALRERLSKAFGPTWFKQPATGEALKSLWSLGTAEDAESRISSLGEALSVFSARTLELTPPRSPADGGVAIGAWPQHLPPIDRPFSTVQRWPAPISLDGGLSAPDGGRQFRDWPRMEERRVDTRWTPRPWPQMEPRRVDLSDAGPASER